MHIGNYIKYAKWEEQQVWVVVYWITCRESLRGLEIYLNVLWMLTTRQRLSGWNMRLSRFETNTLIELEMFMIGQSPYFLVWINSGRKWLEVWRSGISMPIYRKWLETSWQHVLSSSDGCSVSLTNRPGLHTSNSSNDVEESIVLVSCMNAWSNKSRNRV